MEISVMWWINCGVIEKECKEIVYVMKWIGGNVSNEDEV